MSFFTHTVATSALLAATLLAVPVPAMAAVNRPQTATRTPAQTPETVEQRITELHKALNITAAEEADWNGVAKAMRENAAAMDTLMAERAAAGTNATALDDLKLYEKISRTHVDGLKGLTDSFAVLYTTMPDTQKKTADLVFKNFGHGKMAAHG